MKRLFSLLASLVLGAALLYADVAQWVDPRIGSEGLGRTIIGPSCPFGMVKPSPDCTTSPNSGWLPMPARVDGFAQVHVSGTGGGPKYGNILIQPFSGALEGRHHYAQRESEDVSLGYYATTFEGSGIRTEVTTATRASFYRISYPEGSDPALSVDAGFFLGENPVPKAREAQQFEGSFAELVSDHEIRGWSRISGGWNNGAPYTVYFHLVSDIPFARTKPWEENGRQGVLVGYGQGAKTVNVKIGISFLSMDKARENVLSCIPHWSFDKVREDCVAQWEKELGRIVVKGTPQQMRMFYTALYHTMLMPVDRTGEWEKLGPEEPYYDDFYAIWDTYRSSSPLLAIMDPQREVDIVNALLNIYKADGFLPDARSGNSNGRTQGGSNAEIVIADAFVKGLEGIDWNLALEAMIKDAEVVPGDDEAEGRGGLEQYNTLGYVPWGIDRAGNRTIEYAICDYAIYTVAKGLGREDVAQKYLQRSSNWKNLWRQDTVCDGVSGFIMPRSATGEWMDALPFGASKVNHPTYSYKTTTFEGPWYTKWWSSFFYEASSWEYSLSVPHDVPGLIEACGGKDAFEKRLDTFFDHIYYNVNNEPSFLTPCLYHWIGKPEKTSARVLQIIDQNFNDTPAGLPGNDDSGAMSSWLSFHMTGLYPVAGDDTYVIHTPVVPYAEYKLPGGKSFVIEARGLGEGCDRISSITLNGRRHPSFFLTHKELMQGGKMVLKMTSAGRPVLAKPSFPYVTGPAEAAAGAPISDTLRFTYVLNGQTRRFDVWFDVPSEGALRYNWCIERNLRMWHGSYTMSPSALENAATLSTLMPEDGNHVVLPDSELFNVLPRSAAADLRRCGECSFNGVRWELLDRDSMALGYVLMHLRDKCEGMEMWVLDHPQINLIWEVKGNPLGHNYKVSYLSALRKEILANPATTGGIYYAYPVHEIQAETPAPEGYNPFYVSHYGRHGSRYLTDDHRYKDPLDFFIAQEEAGNLTETGREVLRALRAVWVEAEGKGGKLSCVGMQQHHDIATRLFDRYPSLFAGEALVDAVSSTSGRCIASMNSFCDALMARNPKMHIDRDSDQRHMSYIANNPPEFKAISEEYGSFWTERFVRFENENIHPERLCRSLFRSVEGINQRGVFDWLYWVALDIQDIPVDVDMIKYFTPEEMFGKWRTVNYRMYVANCNSPLLECAGPKTAVNLLADVLEDATRAARGGNRRADLRFGHDTYLIRFLSLIGVSECSASEADPERYWSSWQDWRVSPMAANFQMVFYRQSARGPVLVKFLLNEKETLLSGDPVLKPEFGPYYNWEDVARRWASILGK